MIKINPPGIHIEEIFNGYIILQYDGEKENFHLKKAVRESVLKISYRENNKHDDYTELRPELNLNINFKDFFNTNDFTLVLVDTVNTLVRQLFSSQFNWPIGELTISHMCYENSTFHIAGRYRQDLIDENYHLHDRIIFDCFFPIEITKRGRFKRALENLNKNKKIEHLYEKILFID